MLLQSEQTALKSKTECVRNAFVGDLSRLLEQSHTHMSLKETIRVLKHDIKDHKKRLRALRASEEEAKKQLLYQQKQWEVKEHELKIELQLAVSAATARSSAENAIFSQANNDRGDGTLSSGDNSNSTSQSPLLAATVTDARATSDSEAPDVLTPAPPSAPASAVPSVGDEGQEAPLVDPIPPKKNCLLSDIEDIELLHVFSFLVTAEVLTTAQANRYIFQRVDGLFGLDSKVAEASWAERYPVSADTTAVGAVDASAGGDGDGAKEREKESGERSANETEASAPASAASTSADEVISLEAALVALKVGNQGSKRTHATYDDMLKERGRLEMALAAAKAKAEEEEERNNGSGGVTSYFSSFTSSIANSIRPAVLDEIDEETGILPESVLALLRAKLSNAEMGAVDHLNTRSIAIHDAQQEKQLEMDDTNARLLSTESVRDFLVAKLKEAETALKGALKDANRLRKQAQSDAEVVNFLDLQGQENEGKIQQLEHTCYSLQAALNLHMGTHQQIMKTREEEFSTLSAKFEESEATSKATKKLLVKEVKTLRNSLDNVVSERDILKAQIQVIKNSLLLNAVSTSASASAGGNRSAESKSIANSTGSKVSRKKSSPRTD